MTSKTKRPDICVYYFFSICKLRNCKLSHDLVGHKCDFFPRCSYGDSCKFIHIHESLLDEFKTCTQNRPYREEIAHELGRLSTVLLNKLRPNEREKFCSRQILGNYCPAGSCCNECENNKVDEAMKTSNFPRCTNPRCTAMLNDENLRILKPCCHLYCRQCFELLPERFDEPLGSEECARKKFCIECQANVIKNIWNQAGI